MPQMAPLMWLNLMFFFLIIFIVFFIMNYFISIPNKMEKNDINIKSNNKIWKW